MLSLLSTVLVVLSIGCALTSNFLNGKVMGKAGLGFGVVGVLEGSPEWDRRVRLRAWADGLVYVGGGFALAAVLVQNAALKRQATK